MKHSEQINELAAALAKAQASMRNAPKNAQNPHLKNRYADLSSVRDTVIGPLTAQGIAVVQAFRAADPGCVLMVTTLLHSSGQWISSELSMALPDSGKQNPAQVMGSVISYLRRYSLSAICGISADDDDDAEAVRTPPAQPEPEDKIANARKAIFAAKTQAELEAIGAKLQKSDKVVRDAVMGDYAEKLKAVAA